MHEITLSFVFLFSPNRRGRLRQQQLWLPIFRFHGGPWQWSVYYQLDRSVSSMWRWRGSLHHLDQHQYGQHLPGHQEVKHVSTFIHSWNHSNIYMHAWIHVFIHCFIQFTNQSVNHSFLRSFITQMLKIHLSFSFFLCCPLLPRYLIYVSLWLPLSLSLCVTVSLFLFLSFSLSPPLSFCLPELLTLWIHCQYFKGFYLTC